LFGLAPQVVFDGTLGNQVGKGVLYGELNPARNAKSLKTNSTVSAHADLEECPLKSAGVSERRYVPHNLHYFLPLKKRTMMMTTNT
jgi:hypothetical protein